METDGHSGYHSEVTATALEGPQEIRIAFRTRNDHLTTCENNFRFDEIVGCQAEAPI